MHAAEELGEALVPFLYCAAQLVAVDIKIVKQPFKAALGYAALCGFHDIAEDLLQLLVEVDDLLLFLVSSGIFFLHFPGLALGGLCQNIAEKLAGQDEKALLLHKVIAGFQSRFIG